MPEHVKIQSFTDLAAWKEGHSLVITIYTITRTFPKDQLFSLVNQMQRCALSITSNIAEGFSRRTKKDKIQFYYMALGSITELQNQLVVSRDLGFIKNIEFQQIAKNTVTIHKLTNGLIKSAVTHT